MTKDKLLIPCLPVCHKVTKAQVAFVTMAVAKFMLWSLASLCLRALVAVGYSPKMFYRYRLLFMNFIVAILLFSRT